jgi:hypothetical protein
VFTYHLAQPAQKVRLIVTGPSGKVIREVTGPGDAGVIHRVNWDLRYAVPPGTGRGGAGGGGEEGGAAPVPQRPGAIQLPIPSHDIGARGPHVAPGTFKVTLEVDGVAGESRTFDVRPDPASSVTLAQHKAREAFEVEVMELQAKVEALATDLRARRTAATGEEAARLMALEQRLVGGGGGRGRGEGGGRGAAEGGEGGGAGTGGGRGAQPLRQRLGSLITSFVGSGARTGTLSAPTTTMRGVLAEAKTDLAAIEKEIKK